MDQLEKILQESARWHKSLCPRQVLGVRMGLYAGILLNLNLPQSDKRLLTIVETDGCFSTGLSVSTGCWVGRRTLRVDDFGKVAATFVDTQTGKCVRLTPKPGIRDLAVEYAPYEQSHWHSQLKGYQIMPGEDLFSHQVVELRIHVEDIISRPGVRAICMICGEEIMNQREVLQEGQVLCRSCAGDSYYYAVHQEPALVLE